MGADGRNVTSISQPRNIPAFVPAWSTVFRESSIELGSVAPFSVVNPADAVQIIGGRPAIGSERIRRHARRKVREPRPPQRLLYFPSFSRHKCLEFLYYSYSVSSIAAKILVVPWSGLSSLQRRHPCRRRAASDFGCGSAALWGRRCRLPSRAKLGKPARAQDISPRRKPCGTRRESA